MGRIVIKVVAVYLMLSMVAAKFIYSITDTITELKSFPIITVKATCSILALLLMEELLECQSIE